MAGAAVGRRLLKTPRPGAASGLSPDAGLGCPRLPSLQATPCSPACWYSESLAGYHVLGAFLPDPLPRSSPKALIGSSNFTKRAEHDHAENLLVILSKDLAARGIRSRAAHAVPCLRRER